MPRLPIGDIGPCEVTWDYGGDNPMVITPHLGKVSLRWADAVTDVHIDGQGIAPIEAFFEGATLELEVPMARSDIGQLAQTIGYRELGAFLNDELALVNVAGLELSAHAKAIVIKPLCVGVPDPNPNHWTILYKCHPYRDFELGWDRRGQRIHMIKFKVFPNQDTGYEGEYLQEGIPAFLVTSGNKYLDYHRYADVESDITVTITERGYTGDELAAEIQAKMNADGTPYDWEVVYGAVTNKFTFGNDMDWPFNLRWKTGPHGSDNADAHIGALIGFDDAADDSGTNTYTSDNAVP